MKINTSTGSETPPVPPGSTSQTRTLRSTTTKPSHWQARLAIVGMFLFTLLLPAVSHANWFLSSNNGAEGGSDGSITVTWSGGNTGGSVTADLTITGTATNGADYASITSPVSVSIDTTDAVC